MTLCDYYGDGDDGTFHSSRLGPRHLQKNLKPLVSQDLTEVLSFGTFSALSFNSLK
jgi:hypothetical protein